MAGCLATVGDGLSAAPSNPAALSRLKYKEALFTQVLAMEQVRFSYAAYAHPTPWGATAVEYMSLSYGEFERVTRTGTSLGSQSPRQSYVGLGWGGPGISRRLGVGFLMRYYRSELGGATAGGWSANIGARYRFPWQGLSLALAARHIGSPVTYGAETFSQPRTLRLGVGYETGAFLAVASKAKFSLEGAFPQAGKDYFDAGMEITVAGMLSFQAGYDGRENIENRLRFGMGAGIDALELSYSAVPSSDLGAAHWLTARMRFSAGMWNLGKIVSGEYGLQQDLDLAAGFSRQGDDKRAAHHANRVLKKKPQHEQALAMLQAIEKRDRGRMAREVHGETLALLRIGRFQDAEEKIKSALELEPENREYASIQAGIREQIEREKQPSVPAAPLPPPAPAGEPEAPAAASAAAERAVSEPRMIEPLEDYAVLDEPGLAPESRPEYDKALRLIESRDLDQAIETLRPLARKGKKADAAAIKLAECLKGRGVKHFAKGRYEESYRDFQEAMSYNSKDAVLKKFSENVEQMIQNLNLTRP